MNKWLWVKRGTAAGLLLSSLLVLTACGSDLPKGAVAQVGQTFISEDDFEQMKALYEKAGRAPDKGAQQDEYRRFEQAVAEYLVNLRILEQQATAHEVSVTDVDVEEEIALFQDMFQGNRQRFEEALEKQNLTLEQFTEQTRESLLLERMKAVITSDIKVTEAEVKAYYEANKSDYVHPEERETSHILIAVPAPDDAGGIQPTQADWDVARSEAEKIRAEIQNGADFASQARKYSDDETTKESGGQLGPVTKGQMAPAFEEAVFSLKRREVSEPVKTPYGYHLITVTDITAEEQLAYDRVKEGIRSSLLEQMIDRSWRSWLAEKREEVGVAYRAGLEPQTPTAEGSDTGAEGEAE